MPVTTPFGPGLIGPMDDRLWNVLKKLAGQSVTFAEPSRENALVAGSVGANLKPSGLIWDPEAEALRFGPGGFLLNDVVYDAALVESLNGLSGDVTLAEGDNVTLTPAGQTITIAAPSVSKILFAQTADKVTTSALSAATLFGSGVGSRTLPANFLTVGRTLRVRLVGYWKSSAATDAIFRLNIASNTIATITVSPFPTTGAANVPFTLEGLITCRSTGAGGTVIGNFTLTQNPTPGGAPTVYSPVVTATTSAATTGTLAIDFTYQQGGAGAPSATESITTTNGTLEVLGG